jgi:hypothetical protein
VTKVLEKIGGIARIQGAVGAIARFLRRFFGEPSGNGVLQEA